MRRGTTPSLEFEIPFKAEELQSVWITFSQGNTVPPTEVLTKTLEDQDEVVLEDNLITVYLTQEDTLKFSKVGNPKVQAQIRVLKTDGSADASNIVGFPVGIILKEGVIS